MSWCPELSWGGLGGLLGNEKTVGRTTVPLDRWRNLRQGQAPGTIWNGTVERWNDGTYCCGRLTGNDVAMIHRREKTPDGPLIMCGGIVVVEVVRNGH